MGFRQGFETFIDDLVKGGLDFDPNSRFVNGINNTTDAIIEKGGKYAVVGGLVLSLAATPVLAGCGKYSQEDWDMMLAEQQQNQAIGNLQSQYGSLDKKVDDVLVDTKAILADTGEIKEDTEAIGVDTKAIKEDTKAILADTGVIKGNLAQFSGTFADYLEEQAAAGIYTQSPYPFWPFPGPQQIIQPAVTARTWQDIANASRYSTDGSTARVWRNFEGTNEFNRLFGGSWGASVSHLFNGIDSDGEIKSGSGALYIDEIAGKAIFYLRNNRQPHIVDISVWDVKSSAIDLVIRYDTRVDNFKIHTMGYYGQ